MNPHFHCTPPPASPRFTGNPVCVRDRSSTAIVGPNLEAPIEGAAVDAPVRAGIGLTMPNPIRSPVSRIAAAERKGYFTGNPVSDYVEFRR
ncbi:hypothetical protein HTG_02665 [Natrinema mahii]|nr:hypothetical protein HTG_02665 [Natrinema mahii]